VAAGWRACGGAAAGAGGSVHAHDAGAATERAEHGHVAEARAAAPRRRGVCGAGGSDHAHSPAGGAADIVATAEAVTAPSSAASQD
jgi:hypothetical protein